MSKAKDVFSTLVTQIEKLSGKQFSDSINEEKIDIEKVRRYEAKLAAREIAQQRLENHKNLVNSFYQQGILDSKDVFETFVQDNCNQDAFLCAQSFTQSINPAFLSSANKISSRPSLLLLLGNPGTGKTKLCNCIANKVLNEYWKDVEINNQNEIKRKRQPSVSDTNYDVAEKNSQWERLTGVDLLILDGLCQNCSRLSPFDVQMISELLRVRFSKKLQMVITSPLEANALHMVLGDEIMESIKLYNVFSSVLLGVSRRNGIMINGTFYV